MGGDELLQFLEFPPIQVPGVANHRRSFCPAEGCGKGGKLLTEAAFHPRERCFRGGSRSGSSPGESRQQPEAVLPVRPQHSLGYRVKGGGPVVHNSQPGTIFRRLFNLPGQDRVIRGGRCPVQEDKVTLRQGVEVALPAFQKALPAFARGGKEVIGPKAAGKGGGKKGRFIGYIGGYKKGDALRPVISRQSRKGPGDRGEGFLPGCLLQGAVHPEQGGLKASFLMGCTEMIGAFHTKQAVIHAAGGRNRGFRHPPVAALQG